MIYLLTGNDKPAKEQKIAEIKTKYLPSDDALKLDYQLLDGQKCDPAELKKSLIALSALSCKRVVLIQSSEKLSDQNKEIILNFACTAHDHVVVILNADSVSAKNNFFKKLASSAEVIHYGQGITKSNVFDMTRAMENRDCTGALKLLNTLLDDGNHPLQIMGGLVWFWGKSKNRLLADNFNKGLLALQEADLSIKRSRIKPDYAVEIVVTKLSSLMSRDN